MAQFTAYEKAGRLIRLLAWLQVIMLVGIAAAIIIPAMSGTLQGGQHLEILLIFIPLALIPYFFLTLGKAIKEHKDWGRIVGIIYGILLLFGFPLGTLLGGYILWCLIKGWDDQPVKQAA